MLRRRWISSVIESMSRDRFGIGAGCGRIAGDLGQLGQHRAGGVHLVADAHAGPRPWWQVYVHPRTEAYEAVTLARVEILAPAGIAQDALGHEGGHLRGCVDVAVRAVDYHRVTSVLDDGFVEGGVDDSPPKILG